MDPGVGRGCRKYTKFNFYVELGSRLTITFMHAVYHPQRPGFQGAIQNLQCLQDGERCIDSFSIYMGQGIQYNRITSS